MGLTQISTGGIKDNAVTDVKLPADSVGNSEMKDDAVGVAELSASGTASSSTFLRGDNTWATPPDTDTNTQLSTEQVQDIVGAMFTGNTETNITVTYEDSDGTIDLVATGTQVGGATGVDFNDDVKIRSGTGNDLEIYHNGSTSIIDSTTTNLDIKSSGAINIMPADASGITAFNGGSVELYYDNVKKFQTKSYGVDVIGDLYLTDNNELLIGTSSDLKIYHNGTYSYITNATGYLEFRSADYIFDSADGSETYIKAMGDGAVELYYDGTKKFETTSSGATVTGELVTTGDIDPSADGGANLGSADKSWYNIFVNNDIHLADNGQALFGSDNDFSLNHTGSHLYMTNTTGNWYIQPKSGETAIEIIPDGKVGIRYDGTTRFETTDRGGHVLGYSANTGVGYAASQVFEINNSHDANNAHSALSFTFAAQDRGPAIYAAYRESVGKGDLILAPNYNEVAAVFKPDAGCELYYDNVKKLETTSAGGTLTGTWTGAGKVLQVVSTHKNDVFSVSASTGNYSDITGLSVTITPSSSSNKVLVLLNTNFSTTSVNQRGGFRLQRGTTTIGAGNAQSNSIEALNSAFCIRENDSDAKMLSTTFLDSPNTTSATTYKLQVSAESSAGTIVINRCGAETNGSTYYEGASNITVMEIAA